MQIMNLNTSFIIRLREKEKKSCKYGSEAIIMEAIDEVFSSFGQSCKQAIYYQLEKTFQIKKQQIARKIEDFADAIEQIFGIGAKFIEMKIIEVLHEKIQGFIYFPKRDDLVFTEYVTSLCRFP